MSQPFNILTVKWILRILIFLLLFGAGRIPVIEAAEKDGSLMSGTRLLETIPKRPQNAPTGSEFALQTAQMTGRERQSRAIEEILSGNIPDFLRYFKPVQLFYQPPKGEKITALIWVTPDYLAIGSDEDSLRIPLTYPSAVEITNAFDCILPTRKIVDAISEQATCHLEPDPMPPGPRMRSSEYYQKHQELIREQRIKAGCVLGELVAGPKKDVVLTNRLNEKPGRIAIYGWHRPNGKPIQPLSIVHGERYADYSHGIRLVYQTVWVEGAPLPILKILQDKDLAPILTYEGVISKLRTLLRIKR